MIKKAPHPPAAKSIGVHGVKIVILGQEGVAQPLSKCHFKAEY